MNISHCYFDLTKSEICLLDGCSIHAQRMSAESKSARNLFFPACVSIWLFCLKIEVHNTKFTGSPLTNKVIIKAFGLSLILNKSQFTTHNHNRFTGTALIDSGLPNNFTVTETTFDVSVSVPENHITIIAIQPESHTHIEFFTSHIFCPKTYKSIEFFDGSVVSYSCRSACEIDEYTS